MAVQYIFHPERALELMLELGILSVAVPASAGDSGDDSDDSGDDVEALLFRKFLSYLPQGEGDASQRNVLRFIQESRDGVAMPAITSHFGISPNSASGIINGGLQRNIKKAGFATVDPVLRFVKKARQWHYFPGPVLLRQPPIPL